MDDRNASYFLFARGVLVNFRFVVVLFAPIVVNPKWYPCVVVYGKKQIRSQPNLRILKLFVCLSIESKIDGSIKLVQLYYGNFMNSYTDSTNFSRYSYGNSQLPQIPWSTDQIWSPWFFDDFFFVSIAEKMYWAQSIDRNFNHKQFRFSKTKTTGKGNKSGETNISIVQSFLSVCITLHQTLSIHTNTYKHTY